MANSFLENVAVYLYEKFRHGFEDSVVVFPGKRAAVFFKKHLVKINKETIWLPKMLSVSDFFREQSKLLVPDDLKLLFQLFIIYREETKSEETFDQFYFWGNMLLGDFDDIDKYLADASQVFSNVKSLKEIDEKFGGLLPEEIEIIKQFWTNFNPLTSTQHKDEFLRVWKALYNIYDKFRNKLREENLGYEGMLFREIAEKATKGEISSMPWKHVFFVGLNAITPAEYVVMKALQKNGKARFFWDYDEFYLNQVNEAGMFMRENIVRFPVPNDFQNPVDNILGIQKKIKVFSVASNVGQAKNLYRALHAENDDDLGTCVVLADENLLLPALYSIPEEITKVNVTMGFPLNSSNVYHFIRLIIDLQNSAKTGKGQNVVFYFQPVLALLNHQYLVFWKDAARGIKENLQASNRVYVAPKSLAVNGFFKLIFARVNSYREFSANVMDVLYALVNKFSETEKEKNYYEVEKEFVYKAFLTVKRLQEVLGESGIPVELSTYYRILRKALQTAKVDFIGEPLAGLQVMGALETRGLDFKNLVITSMNEGVFPKKSVALSFIPYNLRKAFNLPTYEHQDAIYAYYFYRLLQRAENISLYYNSSTEGITGGEMSRFISQLKYASPLNPEFENIEYNITDSNILPIEIHGNAFTHKVLNEYREGPGAGRYLSPSAINYFKNCSLRFYFRYIAGLEELDEVKEDVDAALFGSILHKALQEIYTPFINETVTGPALAELLKKPAVIDKAIDRAFNEEYYKEKGDVEVQYAGRNIIIREVIRKYVVQILRTDIKSCPFQIVDLETKFMMPVKVNGSMNVMVGGKIDRVDKATGTYRVIDYKTGAKHNVFDEFENLFLPSKKGELDAVMQVMVYSMLYKTQNKGAEKILPQLVYLREIFKDDFQPFIQKKTGSRKTEAFLSFTEHEQDMKDNLTLLLNTLFSEDVVFKQTNDLDYCSFCSYRNICHR